MRLYVYVLEARGLSPSKSSAAAYVKLKVGKHKSRTRAVGPTADPVWNEEFVFRIADDEAEAVELDLDVGVFRHFDAAGRELLGRVRLPIANLLDQGKRSLPPTWFSLQPKHHHASKFKTRECGKILLTMSLYGRSSDVSVIHSSFPCPSLCDRSNLGQEERAATESMDIAKGANYVTETCMNESMSAVSQSESLNSSDVETGFREINEENRSSVSRNRDLLEVSDSVKIDKDNINANLSSFTFEDAMETLQLRDDNNMPDNLQGGVLLEKTYIIEPKDLNSFLFHPNSQFARDHATLQGTTDYQEKPWEWKRKNSQCLTRIVSYTKAPSKLVKSVKATEEQTYLKADGKNFAVLIRVSMPEVPFGYCFEVVLLYKIMPGPELLSDEECSQLVISWNVDFHQRTVMKSMIEGGVQKGLKENFDSFADSICQYVKSASSSELLLDKEQLLAPLQQEHQTDWGLAIKYFCNFTVVSTAIMGLYVLLHIFFSRPGMKQGLEFNGLDLPDSFGELIISGILFLQVEHVLSMVSHFVLARLQRGSDHGIKAQGDGWLLTVALVEGTNLPSVVSSGSADPYVVFSCNGITKTSSVQLQTLDPQWNEIMEFDAMQEPPSVLDVEVFNFDGPFDLAVSLGHAEINFLKHTSSELADRWVPLEGKMAQESNSQLHLRIFLDNTKGSETIRDYLSKMEKEVGKKLTIRSPHKNSTFQKLFGLPPEEFLVSDYSCSLKRKLPLQGRLFLSARIIGFYANLFGHKTNFFFLWEDVDDIQVIPPSLATVGSPALQIILKSSRGLDAKHGAKSQDEEGRLKFQFQSFVSFNSASRTIMALWRTKTMPLEQRAKLEEDQQEDGKHVQIEDTESILNMEDTVLSKAYILELPIKINLLMELFEGGHLEMKIMTKVGCLDYSVTPWESVDANVHERHVRYKFNRYMSIFGSEVVSTQLKSTLDDNGWMIDDVMTLHNVPFGDYFRVHMRYDIQTLSSDATTTRCDAFVGIEWLKSSKFQKRITRNICDKLTHRSKEIFELAEREILSLESH
ncbi:C2 and GRAM domain-containing protein At5g50170-like [Typha latifolia]|uniref:C2 and GRAM domain-containing protein At5g50170-like n=1 Tax=Typha latifolia TaxID=4733 RepID=UPI003C304269